MFWKDGLYATYDIFIKYSEKMVLTHTFDIFIKCSEKMVFTCTFDNFIKCSEKMVFTRTYDIFIKRFVVWSFQKGLRWDMVFLLLSGKIVFFPKTWYFYLGGKWEVSEIFCVYVRVLQTWSHAPLSKKKSKMIFPGKNAPDGDWHSSLTF